MILLSTIIICNLNGIFGLYFGINAPFSPLILVLSIVIIVLSKPKKSSFSLVFKLGITFFLTFWAIGMIGSMSNFISFYHVEQATREIFTSLIILTCYYTYLKSLKSRKSIDDFMMMLFYLYLVTTIFGVVESMLGYKSMYNPNAERSFGFFGNPNETGLQCNLMVLLAYFNFLSNRIKLPLFIFAIGVGAYGAFLTFSKMAILLIVISFIFFIIFSMFSFKKLKRSLSSKFIGFLAILFGVIFFVVIPKVAGFGEGLEYSQRKRIADLYSLVIEGKINKTTTSNRTLVVEEASGLIMKNPILGYGLHSFSSSNIFKSGFGVHNTFLKIIGEAGIFTFLIYILYFISMSLIGYLKLSYNYNYFILGLILILFVFSLGSHTVLSRKFFIPLLGIATAFASIRLLYKKANNVE